MRPTLLAISVALFASSASASSVSDGIEDALKPYFDASSIPAGTALASDANGQSTKGIQSIFNSVVEQYAGILSPDIVNQLQSAAFSALAPFTRPGEEMWSSFNSAISSVTAALSGNGVSAVKAAAACFTHASSSPLPVTCLTSPSPNSPLSYGFTALLGVSNRFAGQLPPNVLHQARNIFMYYFGLPDSTPGGALERQVGNALESVGASLSGNSATMFAQLVACAKEASAGVGKAFSCAMAPGGPITSAQTMVNGAAEQFIGYLPPNLALDLADAALPFTNSSAPGAGAAKSALQEVFDASGAGPAFVTCYEALSDCVVGAIQSGAPCAGPKVTDKCKPLVPTLRRKRSVKHIR